MIMAGLLSAVLFVGYGYLCRRLKFYFFWESAPIGWGALFAMIAFWLFSRIIDGQNDPYRFFKLIGLGIILLIWIVQFIFLTIVRKHRLFLMGKDVIHFAPEIRSLVGPVRSTAFIPWGAISSSRKGNETNGVAQLSFVVKGAHVFLDVDLIFTRKEKSIWEVEQIIIH